MFMYPIFITDDPNASVEIPTLPGQRRWGVNKLEEFIGPLVKKGLESVILFGVPLNCVKVFFVLFLCFPEIDYVHRMGEEHPQTTLQVLSFLLSKNFMNSSLLYTSHAMFVCANTQTTDIVVFFMVMGL